MYVGSLCLRIGHVEERPTIHDLECSILLLSWSTLNNGMLFLGIPIQKLPSSPIQDVVDGSIGVFKEKSFESFDNLASFMDQACS